ncbi:hypothetical protein ACHWQZ_G005685 [Mnemiopsis leidyi]
MGMLDILIGQQGDDVDNYCNLSWENRLYAFGACFVIGIFLSIFGSIEIFFQKYTAFALLYSLGTIVALAGTCFLRGPMSQIKKMFDKDRLVATIVLIAAIILTIVCGTVIKVPILAIICCIVQFLAFTWYTLSYIPYARNAVKSCFATCTGVECPC